MTPKEKANELVYNFCDVDVEYMLHFGMEWGMAKQCALICVDEILNILFQHHEIDYWKEVKQEINKL